MIGEWTYTLDKEHWNNETFDTKEKAIFAGKNYYSSNDVEDDEENVIQFSVGQIFEPQARFNMHTILDDVAENYSDQCGEYAEDWYRGISKEDAEMLEEMMNNTFDKWLKKTNNTPSFYTIKNIEKVDM